jgi:hypothetical protein
MTREGLRQDYAVALMRFLPARDERALTTAYEMGRRCLEEDVSVLDLVRIHHDVLGDLLSETPAEGLPAVVEAAGDFLAELLTSLDLVRRALTDGSDTSAGDG